LTVPRQAELRVGPVTRTQIVRFAGAGGDFNPIHHDEEFARAAGQPTVFAMGQLQAALLARLAADWLGRERLLSLSVRFTAKVWPGDELVLSGSVDSEDVVEGKRQWACSLRAVRTDGQEIATGIVTASLDD
jgi:acyl dehydratase